MTVLLVVFHAFCGVLVVLKGVWCLWNPKTRRGCHPNSSTSAVSGSRIVTSKSHSPFRYAAWCFRDLRIVAELLVGQDPPAERAEVPGLSLEHPLTPVGGDSGSTDIMELLLGF